MQTRQTETLAISVIARLSALVAAAALLVALQYTVVVHALQAQPAEVWRSYDGSGNNTANPTRGAAGTQLNRRTPAQYADGVSTPAGANRPSPRLISNTVAAQDGDLISDRLLSAMIYAFGQFIDHDIDRTPTGNSEELRIPVPAGDPQFDPGNSGTAVITTFRSIFDPATGTAPGNPRQQVNTVSAFIDGSMVYGSDEKTAQALRTGTGGQLKTGPNGTLPLNNAANFPTGVLPMDNDAHTVPSDQLFAAGDIRANENVELTALHTLFVREHNAVAARIAAADPSSSDEQVYQRARSEVVAEIEAITLNEWLPAMVGRIDGPGFRRYDASVDPGIDNAFSTAAFRVGHTLLGDDVEFLDDNGNPVADEIPLSSAFFNPSSIVQLGVDPILKYLASDPASEIDTQVVNSVRNFLFGAPGAGGLDLASLNIARGRDHGLSDYNAVRQAYNAGRARSFSDITSDQGLLDKLQQLYGSIDNVDAWVGLLAEGHARGASVGPTLRAILLDQFTRLRDGDRFWYEATYTGNTLRRLSGTRLADVIRRNTHLSNLQPNVFFFRAGVAGTVYTDANGNGRHERNERALRGAAVQLVGGEGVVASGVTDNRGNYAFDVIDGLRTGSYTVQVVDGSGQVIATSETIAVTTGTPLEERFNIGVPAR
jgi:peroxidase